MNKRRILAWIGILAIPLMLIISIILSIVDAPIAPAFLMITIVVAVVFPIIVYMFTKYPKHLAEMWENLKDSEDKKKNG